MFEYLGWILTLLFISGNKKNEISFLFFQLKTKPLKKMHFYVFRETFLSGKPENISGKA